MNRTASAIEFACWAAACRDHARDADPRAVPGLLAAAAEYSRMGAVQVDEIAARAQRIRSVMGAGH